MEESDVWLELSREDFLCALARLKPPRMSQAYLRKELQLGLVDGEAVFSMEGAEHRQPAVGSWNGLACMTYGMLYPYLEIKPASERVRLIFEDNKLRLGTRRFNATWISTTPTVTQALINAHFMSDEDNRKWRCPMCEAKQVRCLGGLPARARLTKQDRLLIAIRDSTEASHACGNCGYAWVEVDVNQIIARE